MKMRTLPLLLVFAALTLLYACQNTTHPESSTGNLNDATMPAEKQQEADGVPYPNAYSTSTNVSPPLEGVQVPAQTFQVDVSQGRTIQIPETGTRITIPADALVDAQGQPLKGMVDIHFKEYHDVGDILASGIPMRMKAPDGSTGYMQSAGMFDIQGSQAGQSVFVAPTKNLVVELASYYNEADEVYDFWEYDKQGQQWLNEGPSQAQPNLAKVEARKKMAEAPIPTPPVVPYRFNKDKPVLEFDINLANFPELKEMKGLLWQFAGTNPAQDPVRNLWVLQEDWDKAEISPVPESNLYQLTLSHKDKQFSTVVCPSQDGSDFEAKMEAYTQKLAAYEANKLTRKDLQQMAEEQADFIRTARLNGFGIFNYDLMTKDDANILVNASFDFGVLIPGVNKFTKVYMIVDNRNVVCYPQSDWGKIRISPTAKTRMLAILPNQQYATISESEFERLKSEVKMAEGGTYTFRMNLQEKAIASLQELKEIIQQLA